MSICPCSISYIRSVKKVAVRVNAVRRVYPMVLHHRWRACLTRKCLHLVVIYALLGVRWRMR